MQKAEVAAARSRVDELDIVKAVAIILMVMDHSGASFQVFLWKFHMAVFFIASGFFFKESSSDSIQSVSRFIQNRFRRNWIPFFVWNAVFVFLHNVLAGINIFPAGVAADAYPVQEIYSLREIVIRIAKGALFSYKEPLIGGFWFFKILFLVSCAYCVMDYLLKKWVRSRYLNGMILQLIVSFLFLAFGYMCSVRHLDLHGLEFIGSYYCLYYFGCLFHKAREKLPRPGWPICLLILLAAFGALCWLYPRGWIGYNKNDYTTPQYMLACAVTGWLMVYGASVVLNRIPVIRRILIGIGKRTVFVLILHLPALKFVEIAEAYLYRQPIFGLASGPHLHGGGAQLIIYTIIGTGIPIVIGIIYQHVKKKVVQKTTISEKMK